jgi:hypothetical protein
VRTCARGGHEQGAWERRKDNGPLAAVVFERRLLYPRLLRPVALRALCRPLLEAGPAKGRILLLRGGRRRLFVRHWRDVAWIGGVWAGKRACGCGECGQANAALMRAMRAGLPSAQPGLARDRPRAPGDAVALRQRTRATGHPPSNSSSPLWRRTQKPRIQKSPLERAMACKYPGASKDGLSVHKPLCRPSRRGAACPDNTACSAAARRHLGSRSADCNNVNPAPFPTFSPGTHAI